MLQQILISKLKMGSDSKLIIPPLIELKNFNFLFLSNDWVYIVLRTIYHYTMTMEVMLCDECHVGLSRLSFLWMTMEIMMYVEAFFM